jgi:hypothetical protein
MIIGADFDKIEWSPFGLDLVEPNALIGDTILLVIALFAAFKVKKMGTTPFFKNWYFFFVVFGIGFFLGGLGHLCYNYWGVFGKYASWYSGIIFIHILELAMISIYQNKKAKKIFTIISYKIVFGSSCSKCCFYFYRHESRPFNWTKNSHSKYLDWIGSLYRHTGSEVCKGIHFRI